MNQRQVELNFLYQRVIGIWQNFCELHKNVYEITCEEYLVLLESDMDKLEAILPLKEEMIRRIGEVETSRADLIEELNKSNYFPEPITRASDLIKSFAQIDQSAAIPALQNLNDLLIDIIQKIQEQNKKNQVFLNKAMISLGQIKQGFTGQKTFSTYGSDGIARPQK